MHFDGPAPLTPYARAIATRNAAFQTSWNAPKPPPVFSPAALPGYSSVHVTPAQAASFRYTSYYPKAAPPVPLFSYLPNMVGLRGFGEYNPMPISPLLRKRIREGTALYNMQTGQYWLGSAAPRGGFSGFSPYPFNPEGTANMTRSRGVSFGAASPAGAMAPIASGAAAGS